MTDLYNRANNIANHTNTAEQQRKLSEDRDLVRFNVIYGLLGNLQHNKKPMISVEKFIHNHSIVSALENVYGTCTYKIFEVVNRSITDDYLYVYLQEDWFTSYVPTGPRQIKVPNHFLGFKYMSSEENPKLSAEDRLYYLFRDLGNKPDNTLSSSDEAKLLTIASEESTIKGKTSLEGSDDHGKFILFSCLYWYNPWFFIIKSWADKQPNVSFRPTDQVSLGKDTWELKIYEEGTNLWDF